MSKATFDEVRKQYTVSILDDGRIFWYWNAPVYTRNGHKVNGITEPRRISRKSAKESLEERGWTLEGFIEETRKLEAEVEARSKARAARLAQWRAERSAATLN